MPPMATGVHCVICLIGLAKFEVQNVVADRDYIYFFWERPIVLIMCQTLDVLGRAFLSVCYCESSSRPDSLFSVESQLNHVLCTRLSTGSDLYSFSTSAIFNAAAETHNSRIPLARRWLSRNTDILYLLQFVKLPAIARPSLCSSQLPFYSNSRGLQSMPATCDGPQVGKDSP